MKKLIPWTLVILVTVLVIGLPSYFLIIPGKNELKSGLNIKELTSEDILNEKNNITQKYLTLSSETDKKYLTKESELEAEYKEKLDIISAKYTKKMGEDGWFEEQKKINEEKSVLDREKSSKSMTLFTEKNSEKQALLESERIEKNSIDDKNTERTNLIRNGIIKIVIASIVMIIYTIWIISQVNKLIRNKNKVKESWSQIEVALKKRYDLIPNLVSIVKGFAKHESATLEKVTNMRTFAIKTHDKAKEIELNNNISKEVSQIMLLSEAYPDLKSNENFLSLQTELRNTENEISDARELYNKSVLKYQNTIQSIPTNIFANIMGYENELFFSIEEEEKEAPKIDLAS